MGVLLHDSVALSRPSCLSRPTQIPYRCHAPLTWKIEGESSVPTLMPLRDRWRGRGGVEGSAPAPAPAPAPVPVVVRGKVVGGGEGLWVERNRW